LRCIGFFLVGADRIVNLLEQHGPAARSATKIVILPGSAHVPRRALEGLNYSFSVRAAAMAANSFPFAALDRRESFGAAS